MAEKEKTGAPKVDSTLSKGLLVLETLTRSPEGRGVSELSRELGLTKSNTFRLLRTLSHLGYVSSSDTRRYAATMKVWQLGQGVIETLDLSGLAETQLQHLSKETGETVYLAVPNGLSVLYIDKIDSTQPISSFTPKGGSAPIHCVGTGKALLAANYARMRDQVRAHLVKHTDKTITSIKRLDADMDATLARGYAVDDGEYRDRIRSFGVAVHLPNGEAVAAIGVSAPDVNLPAGRGDEICRLLLSAATALTDDLAASGR